MATATFSFSQTTSAQRRTLVAAALGWMFDAFDVMLFALVISAIVADFGISKATAGKLARRTARQGPRHGAEVLGHRIRAGRAGRRCGAALLQLARRVFRRRAARAGHFLDAAQRA